MTFLSLIIYVCTLVIFSKLSFYVHQIHKDVNDRVFSMSIVCSQLYLMSCFKYDCGHVQDVNIIMS